MWMRYASWTVVVASANPSAIHLDDTDLWSVGRNLWRSFAGRGERATCFALMEGLHLRGLMLFHLAAGLQGQFRNACRIQLPFTQFCQ